MTLVLRIWNSESQIAKPLLHVGLVWASLAAFTAAVYIALVPGFAGLFGLTNRATLGLSILATSIVATAFRPVKERIYRLSSRLIYGHRQTPFESISEFSQRVARALTFEESLAEIVRIVAQGTGARKSSLWLRVGTELVEAARWPMNGRGFGRLAAHGEELPPVEGDLVIPVGEHHEFLGVLALTKHENQPITGVERALVSDLASQAALVLRNAQLSAELDASLEQVSTLAAQLRASRRRIVEVHDAERRKIERDLHDEAQQYLLALVIQLDRARDLLPRDSERVETMISNTRKLLAEVLVVLSRFSKGLSPPMLPEDGLVPTIRDHIEKLGLPVDFQADRVGRYPLGIEEAVYYSCLEAVQNAVKHSGATLITLTLEEETEGLHFVVVDDGIGFDSAGVDPSSGQVGSGLRGLTGRLQEKGGSLEVASIPGKGTTVEGRIPISALEEALR